MASQGNEPTGSPGDVTSIVKKPITRRDFMKYAGATGAVVAASGGLGGLLSACGSSGGGGSSSGATGRTIKVGFVSPLTGSLATFGELDQFCVAQWKAAVKDGVKCGDGKVHPIEIIVKDSQSDTNRASTVAGDLITNDNVDVMMVASTPDTVNPVAFSGRGSRRACVSNDCPWQPYYFGRGATPTKPFKWTYHAFWGLEDVTAVFTGMWDQIPTNKLVGEMWPNDADGLGWANPKTGQPPLLTAAGYKFVDGGRFPDGTLDYTPQITKFKAAGCQILSGVFIPPDFVNFWKQSYQQGFQPKVASVGKALLFPAELESIGPIGYGLTTEVWWSPWHPFKSSLTGQTYEAACRPLDLVLRRQGVGAAAAALRGLRGRCRRPQAQHQRRRQGDRRHGHQEHRPEHHPGPHHLDGRTAAEPGPERLPHRARGRHVGQGHHLPVQP